MQYNKNYKNAQSITPQEKEDDANTREWLAKNFLQDWTAITEYYFTPSTYDWQDMVYYDKDGLHNVEIKTRHNIAEAYKGETFVEYDKYLEIEAHKRNTHLLVLFQDKICYFHHPTPCRMGWCKGCPDEHPAGSGIWRKIDKYGAFYQVREAIHIPYDKYDKPNFI